MKLILSLVLTTCQIVFIISADLKATSWYGFVLNQDVDPPILNVQWQKVENSDNDPIIGYRVHVWEVKKIKRIKTIEHSDGTVERLQVEEYPKAKRINNKNVIPEGNLTVWEVPQNKTMIDIPIKLEVPYQFTITAFTKLKAGPPSAIVGYTGHAHDWKSKYEE